jgi:RNA-directed DNA polymerase
MMNDPEKSDSAIVAGKSVNKAGQPATEPMEPRAEAEGNAGQQRTRRAQDRESVSQALDRIRHAAKTRKKERFTALFHHLSIPMLRMPVRTCSVYRLRSPAHAPARTVATG